MTPLLLVVSQLHANYFFVIGRADPKITNPEEIRIKTSESGFVA